MPSAARAGASRVAPLRTAERQHATGERQRLLDLEEAGIRDVGVAIGELEIDLREAQRAMRAQVRDDAARRLVREDLRPRKHRVTHQVDEHVAIVGGDRARRVEVAPRRGDSTKRSAIARKRSVIASAAAGDASE